MQSRYEKKFVDSEEQSLASEQENLMNKSLESQIEDKPFCIDNIDIKMDIDLVTGRATPLLEIF